MQIINVLTQYYLSFFMLSLGVTLQMTVIFQLFFATIPGYLWIV